MKDESDTTEEEFNRMWERAEPVEIVDVPHPDFDPAVDRVVRVDPDKIPVDDEKPLKPYRIAAQLKLFKSGLMGSAVQVWSSYEGGYGPTPVSMEVDGKQQVVSIRVYDDNIEDQVTFAGGYVFGWTEALGGDVEKLDIWLEPVGDPERTPEVYDEAEKTETL